MISLIYICPYSLPQIPRSSALRYSPPTVRLFSILCTSNNLPKGLLFSILSYRETFQYIPKSYKPRVIYFPFATLSKVTFPTRILFFPFLLHPAPTPSYPPRTLLYCRPYPRQLARPSFHPIFKTALRLLWKCILFDVGE